ARVPVRGRVRHAARARARDLDPGRPRGCAHARVDGGDGPCAPPSVVLPGRAEPKSFRARGARGAYPPLLRTPGERAPGRRDARFVEAVATAGSGRAGPSRAE